MIIAMHARVVVAVDAPYSARRLYIPGESGTQFIIHENVRGACTVDTQLTSPEANDTEDKHRKLKKTTGSAIRRGAERRGTGT